MLKDKQTYQPQDDSIVVYRSADNAIQLEVQLAEETVWLTQQQMADLFGVQIPAISKHLANIFREGELNKDSVISILENTAADGKRYRTMFYNLDAILSVGYRVNSVYATQFRQWANRILKDYLLKGYAINPHIRYIEQRIDNKLQEHTEQRMQSHFHTDSWILLREPHIITAERRCLCRWTDIRRVRIGGTLD